MLVWIPEWKTCEFFSTLQCSHEDGKPEFQCIKVSDVLCTDLSGSVIMEGGSQGKDICRIIDNIWYSNVTTNYENFQLSSIIAVENAHEKGNLLNT